MTPNPDFLGLDKAFWAYVRLLGQELGYARDQQVEAPSLSEIAAGLEALGLDAGKITRGTCPTPLGRLLCSYLEYRAHVLNDQVATWLMDVDEAKALLAELQELMPLKSLVPMNKQKGRKRKPAYFTGMVNLLIQAHCGGLPCDFDPHRLAVITRDGGAVRTLSRRLDGAFPSTRNPVAVWEIKEYYHTTTFGSRVADGVYETLLDGMELAELAAGAGVHVRHYLMLDAKYTWWSCGKPYLCRIIDMLHTGYVDEVLFGREVVTRLPAIVKGWVTQYEATREAAP